jgi:hypothetical protein
MIERVVGPDPIWRPDTRDFGKAGRHFKARLRALGERA